MSAAGSIFLASAWACALSSMADRFLSMFAKRGTLVWYMEMVMAFSVDGGEARILPRRSGEKKARGQAARVRSLPADELLNELREDQDQPDDRYHPGQGAQPDDSRDVDDRVGDPRPEEDLRAENHRLVDLAGRHGDENQRREQHQIAEHVDVRAFGAARPARYLGHALAIPDELHQTHLVERPRYRHQHLNDRQS